MVVLYKDDSGQQRVTVRKERDIQHNKVLIRQERLRTRTRARYGHLNNHPMSTKRINDKGRRLRVCADSKLLTSAHERYEDQMTYIIPRKWSVLL
jgi:hypothetical protein